MYSDLCKPSYLVQLCKQCGLSPSKNYGQNFLIQNWPIEKIIEAADLKKTDTVIEIGPGFGILTLALAERVKKVIAFEIEKKLMPYWESVLKDYKIERLKDCGDIEIVWGNVLKELESYKVHKVYKVVANIPYQITSELLRTLLELENKPTSITLMVQKEVAERICAKAGDMSLLAVSVQHYGEPEIIAKVGKGNFWPSPKVDSAILHLTTRPPDHHTTRPPNHLTTFTDKDFFRIVKVGFGNKRKQLWGNLAKGLKIEDQKIEDQKIKSILREVTGNEKVRAEELSVEQWRKIVEKLI